MERIVIFDLDGTLIHGQSQRMLINILRKEKWLSWIEFLLIIIWFILYKMDIVHNADKIAHRAIEIFRGRSSSDLDLILARHLFYFKSKLYEDAVTLVSKEIAQSKQVVIVSASVEPIVRLYCSILGIQNYLCTLLDTKNDLYTGTIKGSRLNGIEKVRAIETFLSNENRKKIEIVVYTDHISDIDLLHFADYPVCVNANRSLRKVAKQHRWKCFSFVN